MWQLKCGNELKNEVTSKKHKLNVLSVTFLKQLFFQKIVQLVQNYNSVPVSIESIFLKLNIVSKSF